ncbi:MAG: hypothetical protein A3B30_01185 [Candidatus Komeilibacteria bacterium RIFCSPLOWO2_01_FULL_52_15]|uniref:Tim44-like domain-containing protein n=1 Tax=Candidatus Komeilibacteria bacterium RIFCSPLOWO2_01_FULL_52_15 TaxID=1798551 RepID=A0A1G2BSL6_9BACT|nr:MAG: hypothetical protein A3B30_01185 [Candidatus Komeilibacteria bacterium RIFCSPLOWO2_01_FULL_52_15]
MEQDQPKYNRKRLAAFGALVLLLALILFLIWWWTRPTAPRSTVQQQPVPQNVVTLPPEQVTPPVPQVPPKQITEGEQVITNLARNFTERYGSFSTDNNYQNLKELSPFITSKLRSQFEKTITGSAGSQVFRGVTTKALNVLITSLTESRASVTVTAQRVETVADQQAIVTYAKLALTMVKQGPYWYVDSAEWKDQP